MKINPVGVVVDDHQLFADSFSNLLEKTNMFQTVFFETNPDKLLKYLLNFPKREIYIFLDYYLQDMLGIEVINKIRRLNKNTKIIVVTTVTNLETLQLIKTYNPKAIISKNSGFDIIVDCLHSLNKGQIYYCPFISQILINASDKNNIPFTLREIELLNCFSEGLSIIQTSEKLFLSYHTVVAHRRRMMAKVQVKTITELLTYARKMGLIQK